MIVSLQRFNEKNNDNKLHTYSPTRYYYSLAKKDEVSLVCIQLKNKNYIKAFLTQEKGFFLIR